MIKLKQEASLDYTINMVILGNSKDGSTANTITMNE
jgi:hypothetical protein